MGYLRKLSEELIAHGDDLCGVFLHVVYALLERRRQSDDTGDILGAGALAALLCAALDNIEQRQAALCVQNAYALGSMELMSGHGQQVDVHIHNIQRHMAGGLNRVGMEGDLLRAAQLADLLDGLHGADLVVCEHYGHKRGILADGVFNILKSDNAVLMDVEQSDLKALLFKLLEGVQHRMVLKLGGYKVLFALDGAELRHGNDGLVIRLGAAGGEVDLSWLCADYVGNGLSRRFKSFLCLLGKAVQARGVAVQP